jgi:calcineurin-like phosphoesterase family protein
MKKYSLARNALVTILVLLTFSASCVVSQIPPVPQPAPVPVSQPVAPEKPFTIVALPDTQLYAKTFPATFTAQTQWIKDNTISRNIAFTIHLGDITDSQHKKSEPVKAEWANAKNAMDLLAGLKYAILPGNHDNLVKGKIDNTFFNSVFPYTDFEQYPWYGGHYPPNGSENSYSLVDVSGQKLLILSLGFFGHVAQPTAELSAVFDWANAAITKYPERSVIVVTHIVINNKGEFLPGGKLLWDQVIKQHENVFLVLCGHDCTESTITKTGEYGNVVNILMSDYQCDEKGGNGYLRIMEFIPEQNIIHVETFSPLTNKLRANSSSFDIPYIFQ